MSITNLLLAPARSCSRRALLLPAIPCITASISFGHQKRWESAIAKPSSRLDAFVKAADEAEALLRENELLQAKNATLCLEIHALQHQQRNTAQSSPAEAFSNRPQAAAGRGQDGAIIYVGIDGDGYSFTKNLVSDRFDGGQEAAERLLEHILDYVHDTLGHIDIPVMIQIFFNKTGFFQYWQGRGNLSPRMIDTFCIGFNAYNPRMYLVDCGISKQAADLKLLDAFLDMGSMQSVEMLILGIANDTGYAAPLVELCERDTMAQAKIHIIGYKHALAPLLAGLQLPCTPAWLDVFAEDRQTLLPAPPAAKHMPSDLTPSPCWLYHVFDKCLWGSRCSFRHGQITRQERRNLEIRYREDIRRYREQEALRNQFGANSSGLRQAQGNPYPVYVPLLRAIQAHATQEPGIEDLVLVRAVRTAVSRSAFSNIRLFVQEAERLGLVVRVQDSPAKWAISESVEDLLADYPAATELAQALATRLEDGKEA